MTQLDALRARLGDGEWAGLRALDAWAAEQGWLIGRAWRLLGDLVVGGEAETRREPVDDGDGVVVEQQWRLRAKRGRPQNVPAMPPEWVGAPEGTATGTRRRAAPVQRGLFGRGDE